MKVAIYATSPHHVVAGTAFAAGLARHGIRADLVSTPPGACDLAVVWGHRKHGIFRQQLSTGGRYLVMERGYTGDRMAWTSLGYDGLNGRADFCTAAVDASRWERHFSELLQPWREGGQYVVIAGQVPGDASLSGVDIDEFYRVAARAARAYGLPVLFRPHPLNRRPAPVDGAPTMLGSLQAALDGAAAVVTWNSNTGTDAAIAGVPVIACDRGSMAYDVAAHAVGDPLVRPDREAWAHRLAWCQWTLEEIARGDAWDHLKRGMDDRQRELARCG